MGVIMAQFAESQDIEYYNDAPGVGRPVELSGIQLLSKAEFTQMDGSNIYATVPQIGEYPNDEIGETWFYVNKKADSFVEVYHSKTDRVYVIKAMDPVFFSKICMKLNKEKEIKLELSVKQLERFSLFASKFAHPDMSFYIEALPDKTLEARIVVRKGIIGTAKHLARNLVMGEDGYGSSKYEKVQQLKTKRKVITSNAEIKTTSGGDKFLFAKTTSGVMKIKMNDERSWQNKFDSVSEETIQEFVFDKKHPEIDTALQSLKASGWDFIYDERDGHHYFTVYKNPVNTRDITPKIDSPATTSIIPPQDTQINTFASLDFDHEPLFEEK